MLNFSKHYVKYWLNEFDHSGNPIVQMYECSPVANIRNLRLPATCFAVQFYVARFYPSNGVQRFEPRSPTGPMYLVNAELIMVNGKICYKARFGNIIKATGDEEIFDLNESRSALTV